MYPLEIIYLKKNVERTKSFYGEKGNAATAPPPSNTQMSSLYIVVNV